MYQSYLDCPWGRMSYYTSGGGKIILLLHDFGQDAHYFTDLLSFTDSFAQGITVDLCGHGMSQTPKEFTSCKTMARDINSLTQQLLAGRVDIVGHGTGGLVALEFARLFPHSCAKLVLLDTFLPQTKREQIFGETLIPYSDFPQHQKICRSFSKWPLSVRDDYILTVNNYNYQWLSDIYTTKEILFVYGARNSANQPGKARLNIPERSWYEVHWLHGRGHDFPRQAARETANIIRQYLFNDSTGFTEEEPHNPEHDLPPPSLGELML